MKVKHFVIGWIICMIFTWIAVALFGTLIMDQSGVPGSPPGLFMTALLDPFSIIAGVGIGTLLTPCCYCCYKEQ
ncbi:MAG: hypothetical protein EAX95_14375 [Candidatus Thorarchaeota archaeon]|nr:hypothetical protein [Candidatus Thorarchaeota archaeon]